MEGLLGSVDLWQFVQNDLVDSHDKRHLLMSKLLKLMVNL
jgi:hypothetical protein